jgi:hypothetical protein
MGISSAGYRNAHRNASRELHMHARARVSLRQITPASVARAFRRLIVNHPTPETGRIGPPEPAKREPTRARGYANPDARRVTRVTRVFVKWVDAREGGSGVVTMWTYVFIDAFTSPPPSGTFTRSIDRCIPPTCRVKSDQGRA